MENYDYAEIEALIAEARRLRSEAVGEYFALAWQAVRRGMKALAGSFDAKARDDGRRGPCLPA